MVVMNKRGRRSYVERRAHRKLPEANPAYNARGGWSVVEIEYLTALCTTAFSYQQLSDKFNARFPDNRKSRNAVLGKASRLGLIKGKPMSTPTPHENMLRTRAASLARLGKGKVKPVSMRDKKIKVGRSLAPVVFKDPKGLRSDAEPIIRRSHPHMVKRATVEEIEERRKGKLPSIIEEHPLTSVPFLNTDGCKWPTNDDVRCMEVCGSPATIGAYCERHANVAYREMPTAKRNRGYARRGMIDTERKRINDADAQWIADNVLDDVIESGDIELVPNFIGTLDE